MCFNSTFRPKQINQFKLKGPSLSTKRRHKVKLQRTVQYNKSTLYHIFSIIFKQRETFNPNNTLTRIRVKTQRRWGSNSTAPPNLDISFNF